MPWDLWWVVIPAVIFWVLGFGSRGFRIFAVLLAAAAVVLFPTLQKAYLDITQGDTSIIRNYVIEYDVAANGKQQLVETLDVEFTESRRGIFRFFDEADGVDPNVTHPVTIESVKRCPTRGSVKCVSEPFDEYYEDGLLVAKIGVAHKSYPAGTVNRYIITSSTTGAITQPTGDPDAQWYWNVIPPGWNMPIKKSQVSVTYPVAPTAVRCITESGECQTRTGENTRTVTGSYADLPPRTPVTWQADLPPQGLTVVPVTPSSSWWKSPMALIPGAVFGLLLAFAIWRLNERRPSEAPVFAEPTPDILPAVWTYKEEPPEHPFQTMLMQLAVVGTVRVEVEGDGNPDHKPDWVKVWREADPVPANVSGAADFIDGLDLDSTGAVAKIEKSDVTIGRKVQSTEGALSGEAQSAAARLGYYGYSMMGALTHLFASFCAPAAIIAVLLFQQRWIGAMLLVPAVVGIWSSSTLSTRLTPAGMEMRDKVSGLRTALSTPASVERFDYSLKARYFAQFLPWAIALDCAEEWAEACKPPPGTEPGSSGYDPTYSAAWSAYNVSNVVSTAVASVSAGAVAAYAATQSSSSSGGGGGFSSGGGSGGGGGGSW